MKPLNLHTITGHIKRFSFSALLLFSFQNLSSENFRVRKLVPVSIRDINEKISVTSGINDALHITLPDDLTYVSGLELTIKVPEDIIVWRDSVAYMLYENLSPSPEEEVLSYYGERTHVATIPGHFSLTLHIPLSSDFSIKDSPYCERLPFPKSFKKEGIFLRFMMVMKGVPETLESSVFEINATPLLKNIGSLNLMVIPPRSDEEKVLAEKASHDSQNFSVFIDDVPVKDFHNKFLSTGEHHLSVVSDFYRNELRTFRVEQAKTTSLSVNLRGIEPVIKLLCPKDAKVFLDGSPLKPNTDSISVTQGEHAVKFIIGDYEVVKTLSAMNGRTYSVSLNVDAVVSEEE